MEQDVFKDYLFEKFSAWEDAQPEKRSSYTAYARFLSKNSMDRSISQQLVSDWIRGRYKPSEYYAPVLAEFFGDEIYELLNIDRPDPDLQALTLIWSRIPEKGRHTLREQGENYVTGNEAEESQQRSEDN